MSSGYQNKEAPFCLQLKARFKWQLSDEAAVVGAFWECVFEENVYDYRTLAVRSQQVHSKFTRRSPFKEAIYAAIRMNCHQNCD